jgi:hypothetical protein
MPRAGMDFKLPARAGTDGYYFNRRFGITFINHSFAG